VRCLQLVNESSLDFFRRDHFCDLVEHPESFHVSKNPESGLHQIYAKTWVHLDPPQRCMINCVSKRIMTTRRASHSASSVSPKVKSAATELDTRETLKKKLANDSDDHKHNVTAKKQKLDKPAKKAKTQAAKKTEDDSGDDKPAKKSAKPAAVKLTPEIHAMMKTNWERAEKTQKFVGAHVSMSGGVENAIVNSIAMGGTSFAMFLKNQRQWASKPFEGASVNKFKDMTKEHGFKHILPHGSYLINLCSPKQEMREKGYESFIDDLQRCEQLGIALYNFHPGSTTGGNRDESIENIADCLNRAIEATSTVKIVMENAAGQGNSVGSKFEELGEIIAKIKDKSRVAVCLDTCHAFAAGYDLRTKEAWDKTMENFETTVGFKYLAGVHLNDSKGELGCGKDRHENIGKGHLTLTAFRNLMNDARFNNIPMILETPEADNLHKGYRDEIDLLYSLIEA